MLDQLAESHVPPDDPWRAIWSHKGEASLEAVGSEDDVLRQLLRMGGYDSKTATLSLDDFREEMRYVAASIGLRAGQSVYEVGCGAGAALRCLRGLGAVVGGLDYSAGLARIARDVLGTFDIATLEAAQLPVDPSFDHVLSVGAFLYFPSPAYADEALRRMVAKARSTVSVIDINDLAGRDHALASRRLAQGDGPPGPAQLFLARDFFHDFAERHDCSIHIDECTVTSSVNSGYRYNAFLRKRCVSP